MKEEWRKIPGFEWREVSNRGRVRKLVAMKRPVYYKLVPDMTGHLTFQFTHKGMPHKMRVARLVGDAFCPDFSPERRAVYLDGDRSNCRADNLKWTSVSEITAHPYSRNPKRYRAGGVI